MWRLSISIIKIVHTSSQNRAPSGEAEEKKQGRGKRRRSQISPAKWKANTLIGRRDQGGTLILEECLWRKRNQQPQNGGRARRQDGLETLIDVKGTGTRWWGFQWAGLIIVFLNLLTLGQRIVGELKSRLFPSYSLHSPLLLLLLLPRSVLVHL